MGEVSFAFPLKIESSEIISLLTIIHYLIHEDFFSISSETNLEFSMI